MRSIGGSRVIDRVAGALALVTTELIVVSNAADAAEWIPGIRVVRDTRPERGSLVGIHTALTAAAASVLVVAWDMPFVNRVLLETIRDRLVRSTYAAVPEGPHGLEGLCAAYTSACIPAIEVGFDIGDLRISAMLSRLPAFERISEEDTATAGDPRRLFFNVNTADDLAEAERLAVTL